MAPTRSSTSGSTPGGAGSNLVVAILGLAVALAAFAVWFQWRQTRRCLSFYGPAVAAAIQGARRVELWTVEPCKAGIHATRRQDVSEAAGLVHLRHGLVEDANFEWRSAAGPRLPAAAWDRALAFFPDGRNAPAAILAIDSDAGWLTVVGKPGRVGLGRLAEGLRTWCAATVDGEPDPSRGPAF